MTKTDIIESLDYIASSPPPEYGGFHPETVRIAREARDEITRLRSALRVACEEIRARRHAAGCLDCCCENGDFTSECPKYLGQISVTESERATDAAIDLATATPKETT